MTREEFLKTVQEENLLDRSLGALGYLKKEPGRAESENTYGWMFIKGRWYPYQTDEKAVVIAFGEYSTESEALERLLSRMRRRKDIALEEKEGKSV